MHEEGKENVEHSLQEAATEEGVLMRDAHILVEGRRLELIH